MRIPRQSRGSGGPSGRRRLLGRDRVGGRKGVLERLIERLFLLLAPPALAQLGIISDGLALGIGHVGLLQHCASIAAAPGETKAAIHSFPEIAGPSVPPRSAAIRPRSNAARCRARAIRARSATPRYRPP